MSETVHPEDVEQVGGKYFKDGWHLPLSERPEPLVDRIERPFKERPGIHEVVVTDLTVTVYASGWDVDEVRRILRSKALVGVDGVTVMDNEEEKRVPLEADTVFRFERR